MLKILALFVPIAACLSTSMIQAEGRPAPEDSSGWRQPEVVTAGEAMVVSAHPQASEAGFQMLEAGGSALDAAVAMQAMLTLVEPQSSGLGGGAFMLYWDASAQRLHALDGRETAPAAADESLFLDARGQPMGFWEALVGGRAVGVPGVLRMLELGHERFGQMPWAQLFEPAIHAARQGFSVSPRLHASIASGINPGLVTSPASRRYFFTEDGQPLPVGFLRRNPELAESLEQIAEQGATSLYRGPLARQLVERVRTAANPGRLSLDDLANYEARLRAPLCRDWLEYRVCGMPPPTSGGATLLQILGLLEPWAAAGIDPRAPRWQHLFTQASRLAYADRARYLADADFVEVPLDALLDRDYLSRRRQLIDPRADMGRAEPGRLPEAERGNGQEYTQPSTSHLVVVDAEGNALSMTTSIEMAFGSSLMVGGFLLNNQLTDFSFSPRQGDRLVANRVAPGKRPRSSMSPLVAFDEKGRVRLLLGSPGGSRIINYVAQAGLAHLAGNLSLQEAVALPHVSNRNGDTDLEAGTAAEGWARPLRDRGHSVQIRELNSGLHGLERLPDGRWRSGVDPRREGQALGR